MFLSLRDSTRGWVSSEEDASFLSSLLSSFGGEEGLTGGFSEGAFSEGALPEGAFSEGAFSEGAFSEDAFSEDALLEGTFPDDATLDLSEWAFFDDATLDLFEGPFSEPATLDVSEGAFSEDAFPDPFELATEAAFSDDGGEGGSFLSLPDFPLFLECPEPASEGAFSGSAAGFFSSVAAFSTAGGGAVPFSFFPFSFFPLSCFPLGPGAGAGGLSTAGAPGSGPFWNFISISGLPSILGREVEERASTLAWMSFLGVSFLGPLPPDIFSSTEATEGALAEPSLLVRIRMKLWEPWWDPGPEWEPW